MSQETMRSGIEALREGDKRRARRILGQIVTEQPDNADAWLYLAASLDDPDQRMRCLREVMRLRPSHAQAQAALQALERQMGRFVHSEQGPPLVTDGQIVGDVPPRAEPPGHHSERSSTDATVLIATVIIAVLAIVGAVALTQFGNIAGLINLDRPQIGPTPYRLSIGVPACSVTEDEEPTLVFINNTEFTIEVLRGTIGEETPVLVLESGDIGDVAVEPGVEVRFAVRSNDEATVGSGATITVSQGNTCRVPVE